MPRGVFANHAPPSTTNVAAAANLHVDFKASSSSVSASQVLIRSYRYTASSSVSVCPL